MSATARPRPRSTGDTADEVVRRIRGMIDDGELTPGTRLPAERELAVRFGVARGSLRTALRTLQGMGVIESRHGSGTYVPSGPPRLPAQGLSLIAAVHRVDAQALYDARSVLEVAVAGLAAQNATPAQVAVLGRDADAMMASLDDAETYWQHDIAFHKHLGEASGNPILATLTAMVADALYERERDRVGGADDLPEATRFHRRILRAIVKRDVPAAQSAMAEHLRRSAAAELRRLHTSAGGRRRPRAS